MSSEEEVKIKQALFDEMATTLARLEEERCPGYPGCMCNEKRPRVCLGCGEPIRRWQRAHHHGIYSAVTPFAWEERLKFRWQGSSMRKLWRKVVYAEE